jgi:capsular exopolysaccharide synthesis family protein
MERIKQAIEKAHSQLQKQGGGAARYAAESTLGAVRQHPADVPAHIQYTQTQVVKLKPEHLEKHRIFAFNKNDPTSVSFDVLRTQVLQKMEENGWRTLAITSPTPAVGKTVIGINLAMSIAQKTDKTALLVDFDLRHPRMGSYLGLSMEQSLNDVLDKDIALSSVLVNPDIQRLVVLPARDAVPNPAEVLSSKRIAELIVELRERYKSRIVIFDLPSLLRADDAISVIPQIECVLMVVANGMSTKAEIEDSLRHLSKANLIGTVFNKA